MNTSINNKVGQFKICIMNKKIFSFILMTALFVVVLSSCEKDDTSTFTVTFDSKGGTPTPATQIVKKGGMVEKPTDPILDNRQFTGWTTVDNATSSLWDFEKGTVTADMTLYANWQNRYSITVTSDENGTASENVTSAVEGELITIIATANSGYRFAEWQITAGDITLSETTDNPATFIMPSKVVEVKAIFVPLVGLLETIRIQQDYKYIYEYDDQNRITKRNGNSALGYDTFFTLDYNAAGDVVGYWGGLYPAQSSRYKSTTFSQDENKITFITGYRPALFIYSTVNGELELNAQGLPVKLTAEYVVIDNYNNANSVVSWFYYTVTLTWQNGNLAKIEWEREDEQGSSTGTKTYTYDDKKTPVYNCNTPKWVLWWLDYYGHSENYNENNLKTIDRKSVV